MQRQWPLRFEKRCYVPGVNERYKERNQQTSYSVDESMNQYSDERGLSTGRERVRSGILQWS